MWSSRLYWKLFLAYGSLMLGVALVLLFAWPASRFANAPAGTRWLLAFGAASLAAPVSYWLARGILMPVRQLTDTSRTLTAREHGSSHVFGARDELGELTHAFAQMQSELSRRVTELQEQNKRLATVLSGMVEGVLAVDAAHRVLLANDACRSLLGLSHVEVVGRPLLEVARNTELNAAVSEVFQHQEPCRREITLAGSPRRVISLLATALPPEPTRGVVIVLHDITELRRLERLRREFVANVSHELKTPLSSIKAYAETLRMGAVHDPQHNLGFVERISEQAERLHRLIVDLLQLARVEAGQEVFQMKHVDLATVVERGLAQHRQLADQKNITVCVEPASKSVTVWGDSDGLFTILSNLLDNAVKYTPTGGQITVRWYLDGLRAVWEVQDTGIGIAPEDQERVFERFYRADRARSPELGGTGLGLAIVKHLAQAFGGSIELRSQLRQGSTFRVLLPTEQGRSHTTSGEEQRPVTSGR